MARDTAQTPTIPRLRQLQGTASYPPELPAPSLAAPFKLDEGYSDETRSQSDKEVLNPSPDDVMPLPDWVLAHSETERAELAYTLLRTLRASTVSSVVERLAPLLHMDPVLKLPPEITSEIFSYLDPLTLLTASLASRAWRSRIFDTRLWRDLYIGEGWRVDIDAVNTYEQEHSGLSSPQLRKSRSRYADPDLGEPKQKKRVPPSWLDSRVTGSLDNHAPVRGSALQATADADTEGDHLMSDASNDRGTLSSPGHQSPTSGSRCESQSNSGHSKSSVQAITTTSHRSSSSMLVRMPNGAAKINWPHLYRQRRRLEENWAKGRFTNFQLPHPSHMEEGHQECVYAIQFTGKWLVSGSRDRSVRVWDMHTKRLWHPPLLGHTKSVLCLQFDPRPSEDIIISGSSDKNVIIWRFSTGEKLHEIAPAHDDSVLNLRFDERYIVTCSKDKLIKVWNRRQLSPVDKDYPSVSQGSGITYPSYIVDTREIPSPILEAEIANNHIRTLSPFSLLMTLDGHTAAVNAIQLNEDEIVSASGDRLIKIWNLRSGACKKTVVGHEKGIACVQFDNRRIISGSNDDTVRIFDHASGAEVACLHGHGNLVRTVQAGFGDPPGAEEALRLEALAVDNEFRDAQRSGANVDLGPGALRRAGYHQNTHGSRNPIDIKSLGAKIPPGGGGSQWGRIVSGSYDESIIIWKKDPEGRWVVGQRLRQVDAAANASYGDLDTAARHAIARSNAFAQQAQIQAAAAVAAAAAAQQQAPPLPTTNSTTTTDQQQQRPAGGGGSRFQHPAPPATFNPSPLDIPHFPHPVHQQQPQQPQPQPPNRPPPILNPVLAAHLNHPRLTRVAGAALPPTSRIFKLQFDAHKIICASQDPRIVGWDFAADDEELREACQFFTGL
ncbi:WD40 repeat-like protein [Aspergillus heteromorphus CBS 117.55]|uniref:Probable E3 ubiquitin ligase complex SCF subunit sconB n=1 Tax=Aspergillus heteromorphus CBS 117.55 TaxID=1448321 RepID=A0A317WMU5_9EURO|nr:WD40 repeat-like protein [Aspergillus heteromorphus CBS 117.55]PWY87593.1 WD40 repeat-like protein [Aspergillus heteromorphus CBS 117.55]